MNDSTPAHESGIRAGIALLRQPDIAKGFAAYFISYFGTAMAPIAMAFGVLELTGSTRESAIVIAAPTIAQIGVLILSGTIADRTSRHRILVVADVVAMTSQLIIAWLFLSGHATVALLTVFMLVTGMAAGFSSPAATGFIPQFVRREDLQAANSLLGMARNGAVTIGAALGGMLVAFFGAGVTLAIDGITFGVSALLIASMRPRPQERSAGETLLTDLRLGWREFTRHTWLWTIVLQFALMIAALEAIWGLLGPAVAREELGGSVPWGFVSAAMGVGTIVGGLYAIRMRVMYPMRVATIASLTFSLVPLALVLPVPVAAICVAAFINGFAGQMFAVLWYTTLQKVIPSHMLSRVSAYDHLGSIGLAPLGVVAGGLMFETIGHRATLWLGAAMVIGATLLVFCVRDVRTLTVRE